MEIKKDEELCKLYGKLIKENLLRNISPSYDDGFPVKFEFDNVHLVKLLVDDYMKYEKYKNNWKIEDEIKENNNIKEIARLISCDIQYELTTANIHDEICESNTVRNYIIEKYIEKIGGQDEYSKSEKR